jgi:hypothetical protein
MTRFQLLTCGETFDWSWSSDSVSQIVVRARPRRRRDALYLFKISRVCDGVSAQSQSTNEPMKEETMWLGVLVLLAGVASARGSGIGSMRKGDGSGMSRSTSTDGGTCCWSGPGHDACTDPAQ